jgi:solute carrier family 25 protein 16
VPFPVCLSLSRQGILADLSGVTSVLFTYPLELIRVRLAFQTNDAERTTLRQAVKSIYSESKLPAHTSASSSISAFTRSIPLYPFYRGFSVSIIGMIPYAGVSFLTYGTLKRYVGTWFPYLEERKTVRDLGCGAIAGAVSQTASYPFEVIRRRMQVGGVAPAGGVSWRDAINAIYGPKGWRGFFVGLSIGYLKVIPMTR